MKIFTIALVILLLIPLTNAATIHGTVYDFSLEPLDNVIIEINTEPKQSIVAKNNEYSFDVNPGEYLIIAKQLEGNYIVAKVEENIKVVEDGDYNLDLILFPSVAEDLYELYDESGSIDINGVFDEETKDGIIWYVIFAILAAGIVLYLVKFKKKKEIIPEKIDDVGDKIIELLKKENGRMTQREIRKNIDLSEAKISLVITELEDSGKIKKIKKGRGNVLILNK